MGKASAEVDELARNRELEPLDILADDGAVHARHYAGSYAKVIVAKPPCPMLVFRRIVFPRTTQSGISVN